MTRSTAVKKPASKRQRTNPAKVNGAAFKPKSPAPRAAVAAVKAKTTVAKPKPAATAKQKTARSAATSANVQVKPELAAKLPVDQKEKVKKPKLVRDSFTMPEAEYQVLGEVKKACMKAGIDIKKSQLLRAGVALLKTMNVAKLKDMLATLPPLKAGRPKKDK